MFSCRDCHRQSRSSPTNLRGGTIGCASSLRYSRQSEACFDCRSVPRPRTHEWFLCNTLCQLKIPTVAGIFSWWARWDLNPQGLFSQRILSPSRIPIPPLAHRQSPRFYISLSSETRKLNLKLSFSSKICKFILQILKEEQQKAEDTKQSFLYWFVVVSC